ncbi:hypothetical protein [Mucilaginibacter lappiensis]|uniref:hypothetical protein n=1 Tax=Mucilaginibacter lappiensis TaxID=354630 RepID=UPI003D2089F9
MQKWSKAIITTIAFVVLFNCYHYIDKYTEGLVSLILTLLIPILFIVIIVAIVKGIIVIIKNRRNLSFMICLPTLIYIVALVLPIPDTEQFESKVLIRGCYEGTQNQSYILYRQDHSFEIHSTGVFFYSKWYTGRWEKTGDTIVMAYNKDKNPKLGTKVVLQDGYFKPVENLSDTNKQQLSMYYIGYCKGAN